MIKQSKKSICVYCGHRTGDNSHFLSSAQALGTYIGQSGYRLVYGGGTTGMMGAVASGTTKADGDILGIIPRHLFEREAKGRANHEVIITDTMHERKKIMVMNSDVFVLLPGGLGSLDEFFELLTWRQLDLHHKPCFVLNVAGFWNPLKALIEQQIAQGFVPEQNRTYFSFHSTADKLCAAVERFLSP